MSAITETETHSTSSLPESTILSSPPPRETEEVKEREIKVLPTSVDRAMPSALPIVAVETFLQRAQRDHKRCKAIVDNFEGMITFWLDKDLFPMSRRRMVDLLDRRIQAAEKSGYDDELYVAYQTVAEMIQGWYFADDLRAIIRKTLQAVREGRLMRQPLRYPVQLVVHLQQQNGLLQSVLEAKTQEAEAAALRYTQELKVKDTTIDRLTGELTQARTDLDEARKDLGQARQDLSQARDDFLSAKNDLQQLMMLQQTRAPAAPPSPPAGYRPRLFDQNTVPPKRKRFKLFQIKKTQEGAPASDGISSRK